LSFILFDIDGTLLLSGGAGMRAMSRAFEATFGVADAFAGLWPAGQTDRYLVSEALNRAGLPDSAEHHDQFQRAYVALLADEIRHPGTGRRGVMPGVQSLLDALTVNNAFHLALLTGNYEAAARIKLAHFKLEGFFPWGTYGHESTDRNELGCLALARARERQIPASSIARAVIVGDTPQDIACAKAAGARVVAVATGPYSVEELKNSGADVAVPDLSDTEAIVELLR
jgi:phosphoglycolate phosphatase